MVIPWYWFFFIYPQFAPQAEKIAEGYLILKIIYSVIKCLIKHLTVKFNIKCVDLKELQWFLCH